LIPKNLCLRKLPTLVRKKANINFRVLKNQYGVHAIHFSVWFLTNLGDEDKFTISNYLRIFKEIL